MAKRTTQQEVLQEGVKLELATGKKFSITMSNGKYKLFDKSGKVAYTKFLTGSEMVRKMRSMYTRNRVTRTPSTTITIRKNSVRKNPSRAETIKGIEWYRINNDTYGNPRYVTHYLSIANDYDKALKIARKIGGRKFHNRQFGGGIAFQSYNLESTTRELLKHTRKK